MEGIKKFMDCWDYSTEELMDMVDLIIKLKKAKKNGCVPKLLEGQSVAMIFNGNSTRTRVSFETAAQELGAHALFLTGGPHGGMHLGKRETIKDTAKVVSSMVDGVVMRWRNTPEMEEFAKHCSVPFFNGMDLTRHPTQTLCDLVTIIENLPEGKELKDIQLTFIGFTGVNETSGNDLAKLLPRFGARVVLCSPEGYYLGQEQDWEGRWQIETNEERRKLACKEGGGAIVCISDPIEAVTGADFVYGSVVCYEGSETEEDFKTYQRDFLDKGYQIDERLLSYCPGAKTMHYLPALRGKEMTDYAMDFDGSLLFEQAENRLHTQRGLLAYLMAPLTPHPTEEEKAAAEKEINDMINCMKEKYGVENTH